MLFQIVAFLLDFVAGLLTGACLLRLYMQLQRVPFGNPVGRLVFALTDWLVLPLRKLVPAAGRWDLASLTGAVLVQFLQFLLLFLWLAGGLGLAWLPLVTGLGVLRVAITGLMGIVIISALLSWVSARSPVGDVMQWLAEPLLRPVRRIVPLVGGVDLSPLVLLVLLQVLLMVLRSFQGGAVIF